MKTLSILFLILVLSIPVMSQEEKVEPEFARHAHHGREDDVFHPDGDNDYYQPDLDPSLEIATFNFCIYDISGMCIFKTDDISEGWDGTCEGELVSDGTYFWSVTYTEFGTPKKKTVKGNVVVEK